MSTDILIVDTRAANTASVRAAFGRAGLGTVVSADPDALRGAERAVLPGVGAFGPAIERLRAAGLDEALRERLQADRPTLAVCLGLQLLCTGSDEAPGVPGLGVVDGHVAAFPAGTLTPQLGWNAVRPVGDGGSLTPGHAYFANSYRLAEAPADWNASMAEHGGSFVAALERGATLACQFHPELSGPWGQSLLTRWVARTEGQPC